MVKMAVLEETTRANLSEKNKVKQNADKKVFLAAQDIEFARCLAGNQKIQRDRALKHLKKWLQQRAIAMPFTKTDFMLLWKGLFYSMWMSDKPLIQEECAETISNLIHSLPLECRILFYQCGMHTLSNEWFGIDQLRLDKFLMLVRRLLRQALIVLKDENWNEKCLTEFTKALELSVITSDKNIKTALGLNLHFLDIFMEELSKISSGHIKNSQLLILLTPFIKHLATNDDKRVMNSVAKNIFRYLLWQSEAGIKYNEKFDVWRSLRFAGGNINALQKEIISDDEDCDESEHDENSKDNHVLDPRAGKVDVFLPQITFSSKQIAELLTLHKFEGSNVKSRKVLNKLIDEFIQMARGQFPLGMHKVEQVSRENTSKVIRQSTNKLIKFDNKIMGKLKKRTKSKEDTEEVPKKKLKMYDSILKRKLEEVLVPVAKKQKVFPEKQNRSTKEKPGNLNGLDSELNKLEATFARNSGLWHVFVSDSTENTPVKSKEANTITINKEKLVTKMGSPKIKNTPQEIPIDSPPSPPRTILFPQNEWDSPLNEGEYEFFVESKKHRKTKPFKLSSPNNKSTPVTKLKGKNRRSLDSNIIFNPFSKAASPTKKVKINLRLNKSQEIYEHEASLKSSPSIPFDANRKPVKPLLKTNAIPSPLNPWKVK